MIIIQVDYNTGDDFLIIKIGNKLKNYFAEMYLIISERQQHPPKKNDRRSKS